MLRNIALSTNPGARYHQEKIFEGLPLSLEEHQRNLSSVQNGTSGVILHDMFNPYPFSRSTAPLYVDERDGKTVALEKHSEEDARRADEEVQQYNLETVTLLKDAINKSIQSSLQNDS